MSSSMASAGVMVPVGLLGLQSMISLVDSLTARQHGVGTIAKCLRRERHINDARASGSMTLR